MKILVQTESYRDERDSPYYVVLEMDGEVVLEGDISHDEIFMQIDGFKAALKALEIVFDLKIVQNAD